MGAVLGGAAQAQEFSARLSGFEEVGGVGAGQTGAILSNGTGKLSLDVDKNSASASYRLSYSGLSSDVTQSHIHFGKRHVGGGIMVWLFQSAAKPSPTPGTPTCPAGGGTVTGTLTPANVVAIGTQNVTAGDFDALRDALASDTAYVNVHTVNFPAGEIRGQVRRQDDDDK